MTTTDFYNFAVLAAQDRGFENPNITTMSSCFQGAVKHSCQIWLNDKRKHVNSGLRENPLSAIQAFKDALEFENNTYSKASEDIEL
jgi:hypothetical protein